MRDINPLNVLNQREVSVMPTHFTKINHTIPFKYAGRTHSDVVNHVKNWIFNNLDGRFTVADYSVVDNEYPEYNYIGSYDVKVTVGFEIPEESTFFALAYQPEETSLY